MCRRSKEAGYTLVEIVLTLLLIAIVATVGALSLGDKGDSQRYERTRQQMEAIRVAILGDLSLNPQGRRSNFGFAGDWGLLPTVLSDLINSLAPVWAYNPTYGFGVGWKGPYLNKTFNDVLPTTDGWGQAFVWNTASDPATITSYGSDGTAGTTPGKTYSQDIVVQIPTSQWRASTVRGRVLSGTRPLPSRTVEIRYPSAGSITSATATTDLSGNFTFTTIPFGIRSLQVTAPTPTLGPKQVIVDTADFEVPTETLNYFAPEVNLSAICCRLSANSTTAIPTTDQNTIRFIYYLPYKGDIVPLFDGVAWRNYRVPSGGVSLDLNGTLTNTNFDLFLYDNNGTLTLEQVTWTNSTTRAVSLAAYEGIQVKSTDYTHRYVGTGRTSALNRTDDSQDTRYLWNYYNRVKRPIRIRETAASWTYTTGTWRCANNSTTNHAHVVVGTSDAIVELTVTIRASNTTGQTHYVGIEDLSDDPTDCSGAPAHVSNADINGSNDGTTGRLLEGFLRRHPTPGNHVYQWVEHGGGTGGTTTWVAGGVGMGLHGFVEG